MSVGFNLDCCWFISTVQPESKPEEVSAPKDVASPASPPASVCPVSAAKPPRTNTSSPSAQASAAPALSTQVRPRAGNGNDRELSLGCADGAFGSFPPLAVRVAAVVP